MTNFRSFLLLFTSVNLSLVGLILLLTLCGCSSKSGEDDTEMQSSIGISNTSNTSKPSIVFSNSVKKRKVKIEWRGEQVLILGKIEDPNGGGQKRDGRFCWAFFPTISEDSNIFGGTNLISGTDIIKSIVKIIEETWKQHPNGTGYYQEWHGQRYEKGEYYLLALNTDSIDAIQDLKRKAEQELRDTMGKKRELIKLGELTEEQTKKDILKSYKKLQTDLKKYCQNL
jgi:hypothetical protein